MKIWLDDIRPAPEDWYHARDVTQFKAAFRYPKGEVEMVSLDHDLGDYEEFGGNGYNAICWLEEMVLVQGFPAPFVSIHTANSGVREKMEQAAAKINAERNRRNELR